MDIDFLLVYAFQALPYGIVIAAALGFVAFMVGLYRNPLVAVAAVLILTVWEAAEYELGAIRLGIYIYPQDVVFVCIGIAVALRLAFVSGAIRNVPRPLTLLLSLMAISVAIGLGRYGTTAGVQFRDDFYLWVTCLYFVTFPPAQAWLDRLLTWWLFAAGLLCLIVWYRWAADAFGWTWFDPVWRYADSTGVGFRRVAPASVAYALGAAFLVSIATLASGRISSVHFVFLPALLMSIVLLQHRSVWVATLLPMLLLLLLLRSARRQSARGPLIVAVASIIVVAGVLGSGALGEAESSVAEQAASATSTTGGTFVARVDGWKALLGQWSNSGPVGLALGQPYGSGFERHQGGNWGGATVSYAPHNYYVAILLRTGPLGLAAFVALLWGLFRTGLAQTESTARFGPPFVGAIAASLTLFSIPYSPTTASGLLLGAAICFAYRTRGAATQSIDAATDAAQAIDDPARDAECAPASKLARVERVEPL